MAIIFTESLAVDRLLMGLNNNIIRFYSDSELAIVNCQMSIGVDVITIYPNPQGKFYYNFKEMMSQILNTDNYEDNLSMIVTSNEFTFDWSRIYKKLDILVKINFSDESFDEITINNTQWLAAYSQIKDFRYTEPSDLKSFVLSPFFKYSEKKAYLKYWEGYPFDFTIHTAENPLTISSVENFILNTPNKIHRIALNDVINYSNLEQTFVPGENKILINPADNDFVLTIEKVIPTCKEGHYFKWMNRYGGWNYWLFKKGRINLKSKSMAEVNNDFENHNNTMSPSQKIGITASEVLTVTHDFNAKEFLIIQDILDSPKVYLFTGQPYDFENPFSWLGVNVTDKTNKIQDAKYNFINLTLDIDLPNRNSRAL